VANHHHRFVKHVGITTSFGATAWVPWYNVFGGYGGLARDAFGGVLEMQRCLDCGEQGYEVARAA